MMRRDRLCPSPDECPEALTIEVQKGLQEPAPCEECPLEKLQLYLASQTGQIMSIIIDLDFALQSRIQVPLDRISYREFLLLRLLAEERNKHEIEQIKSKPHGR